MNSAVMKIRIIIQILITFFFFFFKWMTNLICNRAIFFLVNFNYFSDMKVLQLIFNDRMAISFFFFFPATKINCKRVKGSQIFEYVLWANHLHLPPKFPRSHWPLREELAGVWRSERPSEIVCGSFK